MMNNPVMPIPCEILKITHESDLEWNFRVKTDVKPAPGQFMQLSIPMVGEASDLGLRRWRRLSGIFDPFGWVKLPTSFLKRNRAIRFSCVVLTARAGRLKNSKINTLSSSLVVLVLLRFV